MLILLALTCDKQRERRRTCDINSYAAVLRMAVLSVGPVRPSVLHRKPRDTFAKASRR